MAERSGLGFGGLLRQLRAEAGLTQDELAGAAQLSPRSVSDLERGINRTARKNTAELLADALNLDGPTRELFVAAARGRIPATQVLAAIQGQPQGRFAAGAGGVHGFAAPLTSFVGRHRATSEVADLLEEYRLVTVTGPGGVGKTRLAGEVAGRVAGRFADGVWLAELAPVADPAQVPGVVAAALGVRELPGVPLVGALACVLARRQLLLVLDNCEHVIGAAAALCVGLLLAADDVRVLATSREPLRVAAEARYRLAPLGLPGHDDAAVDAGKSEAVRLFADRARQADARFALTGDAASAIERLVTRLDGMPLAIELAAARVEALGLRQLLDGLDDRFDLLSVGDRLAPSRQRSLAAAVQWSYQLLTAQEQRVFRKVSLFPAPFTLQAAEAVAGVGAGPAVLQLVDRSLLAPPRSTGDGRSRYGMLETLRAYGTGLLAQAGEKDEASAALAGYALRLAENAAAGLQASTGEVAAALWLDAEDATVHQSLTWMQTHDRAAALRLAAALAPWWRLRGRYIAGTAWLRAAADHASPGGDLWCAAHIWLGSAAANTSDFAEALGHFTVVRDARADQPPTPALVDALSGRAIVLVNTGHIPEGIQEARESATMARAIGYPAGEALALANLSLGACYAEDLENAMACARQAQKVDPATVPGRIARWCNEVSALVKLEAGQIDPARAECAEGLSQARQAGDLAGQLLCSLTMARLDVRAGRLGDACAHLREALEIGVQTSSRADLAGCLDCCGHLCAAYQRWAEAVTIWAAYAARAQAGKLPDPPPAARHRREPLRSARHALGPDQTQAAELRGAAMTLATAVDFATMITVKGLRQPSPPGAGLLSPRERELVALVGQGRTDAQIAEQLLISVRTVRSHLDRIRDKTGCRRRADLTRLALHEGLA
jgi:predicted ATPase/DNA-binding CsgD family transcriptional regulator/DNA-binding XRE family transcriptional regulator